MLRPQNSGCNKRVIVNVIGNKFAGFLGFCRWTNMEQEVAKMRCYQGIQNKIKAGKHWIECTVFWGSKIRIKLLSNVSLFIVLFEISTQMPLSVLHNNLFSNQNQFFRIHFYYFYFMMIGCQTVEDELWLFVIDYCTRTT